MALRNDQNSKEGDFDMSDYSTATYIRQNSENLERLTSVTESVCLTEEERHRVDMELLRESAQICTCNPQEYCSPECKDSNFKPRFPKVHFAKSTPTGSHKTGKTREAFAKNKENRNGSYETRVEMNQVSSKDSLNNEEKNIMFKCLRLVGSVLIIFAVAFVIFVAVITLLTFPFGYFSKNANPQETMAGNGRLEPARHIFNNPNFTFPQEFFSFSLDKNRFVKGGPYLRWEANERSRRIILTEDDCLRLPSDAYYEIYSKVTFEFWPENKTSSVYHNIQLFQTSEVLEKNVVSFPLSMRPVRMLKSSLVFVLGLFRADDIICVRVQDTSLVYKSKVDSSLKVIKKLD